MFSEGLAFLRAVTTAHSLHKAVVAGGKCSNDLPYFRPIYILLINPMTSGSGSFHAVNSDMFARRYLASCCFRFGICFLMVTISECIVNTVYSSMPCRVGRFRVAETYG
jgi:hypothetical protein